VNGFAPNSHGRRVLIPRSDEFEGQGKRSKVKGENHQGQTNGIYFSPIGGLRAVYV